MIAVMLLGMTVVIALVGIRYTRTDEPQRIAAVRTEISTDIATTFRDMHSQQQQIIDELQMTRDHVIRQQNEIRRLALDLQDVSQKMDTLRNAFAREPRDTGRR